MAVNPATPVYGTNEENQLAAVVDVDISSLNPSRPTRTSAKARVVWVANASGGGGGASTIADGADVAEGSRADAAYADPTAAANGTVIALLKGLYKAMFGSGVASQATQGAGAAGSPIVGNPNLIAGTDGTNARTLSVGTDGVLQVRASGTTGLFVTGNTASGTTDIGGPIKIGGVAASTAPTAVAVGQRVNAWYSLAGAQVGALVDLATGNTYTTVTGMSDGFTNGPARMFTQAFNAVYNGTTWDRLRKANIYSRIASSASGGSPTSVKTTAGDLRKFFGQNGAAITYLQLYNKASAPVLGTDTPTLTYPIPANATFSSDMDAYFGTGVAFAFTTDAAGATGAAAAAVTAFGFLAA